MTLTGARIFHVNVNCSSLDAALGFWTTGLGLRAAVHTAPPGTQPGTAFGLDRARWNAWILTGRAGFEGGAVDLLEWQEPDPEGAPPPAIHVQGLQRVGVLVPDLDAALARVARTGGRAWSEPFAAGAAGAADLRLAFASDPDGTAVELIERRGGPALSFVAVTCTDLDRSVAFYQRLGFVEVGRFHSHNEHGAHLGLPGPVSFTEVMLRPAGGGDVLLGLVGFDVPAVVHQAELRPANTLGLWRVAVTVPDLDAACHRIRAAGIDSFLSGPVAMHMGADLPELRFVCLRGPDGEVLELIEHPA